MSGMTDTIAFQCPLPPQALRLNHRAQHWAARSKAADEYSAQVTEAFITHTGGAGVIARWKAASVTYTWRYAGPRPDIDNIAASVKVIQDTLCSAPPPNRRSKDKRVRWYLAVIEDDGACGHGARRQAVALSRLSGL